MHGLTVTCTGFEPVNAALRGQCVEPLHQHAIVQGRSFLPCCACTVYYNCDKCTTVFLFSCQSCLCGINDFRKSLFIVDCDFAQHLPVNSDACLLQSIHEL